MQSDVGNFPAHTCRFLWQSKFLKDTVESMQPETKGNAVSDTRTGTCSCWLLPLCASYGLGESPPEFPLKSIRVESYPNSRTPRHPFRCRRVAVVAAGGRTPLACTRVSQDTGVQCSTLVVQQRAQQSRFVAVCCCRCEGFQVGDRGACMRRACLCVCEPVRSPSIDVRACTAAAAVAVTHGLTCTVACGPLLATCWHVPGVSSRPPCCAFAMQLHGALAPAGLDSQLQRQLSSMTVAGPPPHPVTRRHGGARVWPARHPSANK